MDGYLEVSAWMARGLLGLVFLLAGLTKARAPDAFERSLAQYGVLPARLRPVVAGFLPVLEVLIGTFLVLGVLVPQAGAVALVMLVAFTAASLVSPKTEAADCGCFGSFGTLNVKNIAARNAVFGALAAVALVGSGSAYTLQTSVGVLPALTAAAAVAVALLVAARSLGAAVRTALQPEMLAADLSRRSFLGKLAVLGAGSLAAGAMVALRGAPTAEACNGCTSCGYAYYWIACQSGCCAAFWAVPMDYCAPSCYTCGSWFVQIFCGYPQCC